MYSVTGRINNIRQPYGGYIKRTDFNVVQLNDGKELFEDETVKPGLVGIAVDYLTRFLLGTPAKEAFHISLLGALFAHEEENATDLLHHITGLDSESVTAACKLAGYDVCYRASIDYYKPVSEIVPDEKTIENIIILVERSLSFWETYGPAVMNGFTFEGGYTPIVSTGDGDYLTKDTIWDFKVSKKEPTSKHTLQLLVYYIMGLHSSHKEFKSIEHLGLFNPRLNKVYEFPIQSIPEEVINTVSHDVIGYGWTDEEYDAFRQEMDSLKVKSYKVGDYVLHNSFGKGIIKSLRLGGTLAEVIFESNGRKLLQTYTLQPFSSLSPNNKRTQRKNRNRMLKATR